MQYKIKILAIGNSFSEDATAYLEPIAASANVFAKVRNVFYPGCSLQEHYHFYKTGSKPYDFEKNGCAIDNKKYSLVEILKKDEWDIITFQQSSPNSGVDSTYEPFLTELLKIAKKHCPRANFWLHRTWAYDYNSDWKAFNNYNNDRDIMFSEISKATNHMAQLHHLSIIPVGDYIQEIRKNEVFDTRNGVPLYRDGGHLSYFAGRYLAGLVWFRYLLQGEVSGVKYKPEHITNDIKSIFINSFR